MTMIIISSDAVAGIAVHGVTDGETYLFLNDMLRRSYDI